MPLADTVIGVSHEFVNVLCERPFDFRVSFERLAKAVMFVVNGEHALALEHLAMTRHMEIREWFITCAQVAGSQRHAELGHPEAQELEVPKEKQDSRHISVPLGRSILERDGYLCRYCQIPVFYTAEAKKLQALFGAEHFRVSKSNRIAHGTLRAFYNSFDHVVPLSRGGRTSLDNLVTACYPCNFGKDNFTLNQLLMLSPFGSSPTRTGHDGFTTLLRSETG
jgi:hypothetical protein